MYRTGRAKDSVETFTGTSIGHFRDHRLVEDWYTYDTLDFLLGLLIPLC